MNTRKPETHDSRQHGDHPAEKAPVSANRYLSMARLAGAGFSLAVLAVFAAAGCLAFYTGELNRTLPDYRVLAEYRPAVTTRVYAADGSLLAGFARERRLFVPIETIPVLVKSAFISAEDKNFYRHEGLDFRGIARAQMANITNVVTGRRLEGGSTITQQVAKNFLLSGERSIRRKLREMLIAAKMERSFTKDHILELYLNEIYLGNRSYGVAAAALHYFGSALDDLTVAQAAYLAAIPKGPANYHPARYPARAIRRRNWVIGRMLDNGYITKEQAESARAEPLDAVISPPPGTYDPDTAYFAEAVRKQVAGLYGFKALYDGGLSVRTSLDPDLQRTASRVLRKWLAEYDRRHGWRGPVARTGAGENWREEFAGEVEKMYSGRILADDVDPWRPALVLSVTDNAAAIGFPDGTTATIPLAELSWARRYISPDSLGEEITDAAQVLSAGDVIYAEKVPSSAVPLPAPDRTGPAGMLFTADTYALRQIPAVNGALVSMDPHTGRVIAMTGGFSFRLSEFNRAVQARRQPGSTFKPFVYAVALDNGYTPSSRVLDAPFVAPGVNSWYKPGNYIAGRYHGESTLRLGLEQSRNTMTARLAQDLGIGRIIDYVERFDLSGSLPRELAISLGADETTLIRLTAAYATFVNGGKKVEPTLIDRIQDRTGKTVFRRDMRECTDCNAPAWAKQAEPDLEDTRARIMDPATAYQITSLLEGVVSRGTGSAVRRISGKTLAGKTGTTNDFKDAWFVGFSPDMATGVYVGYDLPRTLGRGESGGRVAAPVFADFMNAVPDDKAGIPFRVPPGIRLVRIHAETGKRATRTGPDVILEAFKSGDFIDALPSVINTHNGAGEKNGGNPDRDLDGLY